MLPICTINTFYIYTVEQGSTKATRFYSCLLATDLVQAVLAEVGDVGEVGGTHHVHPTQLPPRGQPCPSPLLPPPPSEAPGLLLVGPGGLLVIEA